jgi:hypothetical protein
MQQLQQQLQQERDSHAQAMQGLQQQLDATHAVARQQAEAMAAGDASQMDTHVSAAVKCVCRILSVHACAACWRVPVLRGVCLVLFMLYMLHRCCQAALSVVFVLLLPMSANCQHAHSIWCILPSSSDKLCISCACRHSCRCCSPS